MISLRYYSDIGGALKRYCYFFVPYYSNANTHSQYDSPYYYWLLFTHWRWLWSRIFFTRLRSHRPGSPNGIHIFENGLDSSRDRVMAPAGDKMVAAIAVTD